MPNINAVHSAATAGKRSVDAARIARRTATATGGAADAGGEVSRVENTGGKWDPHLTRSALSSRSPHEGGWGGWEEQRYPDDSPKPPWRENTELTLLGGGGIRTREDVHERVVGQSYLRHVAGNQTVRVGGDITVQVAGNTSTSMSGSGPMSGGNSDRLHVKGDATWHAKDKIIMSKTDVMRRWEGGILRMIGMEGVICGGGFAKTYTGVSATFAPLASGDVYGGGTHHALSRIHVSGRLGYRSSELGAWRAGSYRRFSVFTTEPLQGSQAKDKERNWATKLGRIGLGICPLADIAFGLGSAVVGLGMTLTSLIMAAMGKKKQKQPKQGIPRTLVRKVDGVMQQRTADYIL